MHQVWANTEILKTNLESVLSCFSALHHTIFEHRYSHIFIKRKHFYETHSDKMILISIICKKKKLFPKTYYQFNDVFSALMAQQKGFEFNKRQGYRRQAHISVHPQMEGLKSSNFTIRVNSEIRYSLIILCFICRIDFCIVLSEAMMVGFLVGLCPLH